MATVSKWLDAGFAIATNLLSGLGGTIAKYGQWGTGSTAPAHGDTALQTPANEARVSGTVTRITTNAANDTLQIVVTITSASTQTISEFGLFDAAGTGAPATGGNISTRSTFTGYPLGNGDSIQFTSQLVLTSGT